MPNQAPIVFISYKREDEKRNNWVAKLTTDLRKAGVNAILDIWEVRFGESLTDYMALKIKEANAVLFIITEASVQAVESPNPGGALKFELQMANARRLAGEPFRLIGIYREGPAPPIHIRDNRYADFRDDSKYDERFTELIRDLLGQTGPPALTTRVSLLHRELSEIEALLPRYPDDASLLSGYLRLVEKKGTSQQVALALERAKVWIAHHPKDTYVGRFYIGLVERRGTAEQIADMLNEIDVWLRGPEHAGNASVRSAFLGVVGRSRQITQEQLSGILEETKDWLTKHPNDLHGRAAYLSLVGKRGTVDELETALEEIATFLNDPSHADDTHVRLTYLGVIGHWGTDAQVERALDSTESWLMAHPEDIAVRQAYRKLKMQSRHQKR